MAPTESPAKRRRGRPKSAKGPRRVVAFSLSAEEAREWEAEARRVGQRLGPYARDLAICWRTARHNRSVHSAFPVFIQGTIGEHAEDAEPDPAILS